MRSIITCDEKIIPSNKNLISVGHISRSFKFYVILMVVNSQEDVGVKRHSKKFFNGLRKER
jgi:hypothetical protein